MSNLPGPLLTLLEAHAGFEMGEMLLSLPLLRRAPLGDGHPVLLLPGCGAGEVSLEPLRAFLKFRHYFVETWGLGRNVGFSRRFARVVEQKFRYLHHRYRRKVSLVGWSLGGVFAFHVAHVASDCVRTAISPGSPLRLDPDLHPPPGLKAMYRVPSQPMGPVAHQARSRSMRAPPPVPATCIYSQHDGFVPSAQATLDGDPRDHESIRVSGSHIGLDFNRLAQPKGAWRPYRRERDRLAELCDGRLRLFPG